MTNEERLKKVFAEVFELRIDQITDNLSYKEYSKWDSIAHMSLVAAIDMEFNTMMDTDEIIDLSSFLKAKEILSKHDLKF